MPSKIWYKIVTFIPIMVSSFSPISLEFQKQFSRTFFTLLLMKPFLLAMSQKFENKKVFSARKLLKLTEGPILGRKERLWNIKGQCFNLDLFSRGEYQNSTTRSLGEKGNLETSYLLK